MELHQHARVFVAGHRGLVGSAIVRRLRTAGFDNLLSATREQLDLKDQAAVNYWFRANRPEYVFLVAGTVGDVGPLFCEPQLFGVGRFVAPACRAASAIVNPAGPLAPINSCAARISASRRLP